MTTRITTSKPAARLKTGDAVLRNAQAVDTAAVKPCLDAFAAVHRIYGKAQDKVTTAEDAAAVTLARVAQLDADQDDAVEALALCLANDGEPRSNPFGGLTDQGPGTIKALPPAEAVQAIQMLVTAVQRSKGLSPATQRAARSVAQRAEAVAAVLPVLETQRAELQAARGFRDTIAQQWDAHCGALRLAARGAAATSVPGLYTALFGRPARTGKKPKDTAAASPVPTPAPAPAPTVTPEA